MYGPPNNPYSQFLQRQPAAMPQRPQTAGGMGPYAAPAAMPQQRVQARGMQFQAPPSQPIQRPEKQQGMGGMAGAGGGMMAGMMSDARSKEEIRRLESTNDALTKALDASASRGAGESNLPPTEYPRLPQNTRVPVGHSNFADTPAANTVAAQNVGMQAGGDGMAPPHAVPANMAPMAIPQGRPATVGMGWQEPPDLSALDDAYRKMGQGGG